VVSSYKKEATVLERHFKG